MERANRAPVTTFYAAGAWAARVELDAAAVHHAAVKRLQIGDPVRLTSGDGRRVMGTIAELSKRRLAVAVGDASVERVEPPPHVELWTPVGDRDRMLLLAEKAVELGATSWRPIVYRRSRSVSPRGEGDAFREKVRLRMISALEQSGSAWLPTLHAETTLERALSAAGPARGILLDAAGTPFAGHRSAITPPVAIALGPEGGLDAEERSCFVAAGWRTASLGPNVLRFETAGIAALAVVRSLMP